MIAKIENAIRLMYPFWSFVTAVLVAQILKPFFNAFVTKKINLKLCFSSGSFPSSHSAGVSSLALATGIQEKFSSTIFAITIAFAIIVIYDAANVRYFAGKNIKLTKQLIKDLKNQSNIEINDEEYDYPKKEVLGHTWVEVFGGIVLGLIVSIVIFVIGY